jgi:hypothetical protein
VPREIRNDITQRMGWERHSRKGTTILPGLWLSLSLDRSTWRPTCLYNSFQNFRRTCTFVNVSEIHAIAIVKLIFMTKCIAYLLFCTCHIAHQAIARQHRDVGMQRLNNVGRNAKRSQSRTNHINHIILCSIVQTVAATSLRLGGHLDARAQAAASVLLHQPQPQLDAEHKRSMVTVAVQLLQSRVHPRAWQPPWDCHPFSSS